MTFLSKLKVKLWHGEASPSSPTIKYLLNIPKDKFVNEIYLEIKQTMDLNKLGIIEFSQSLIVWLSSL